MITTSMMIMMKDVFYNMNIQVYNGYEYVDLGLPSGLKWATCNVGATSPEQTGMYFAWGETKGYTNDNISSNVRSFNISEYTGNSASLISDDLIGKCDAAHIYMKGSWRTPINKDFTELVKNTYKTWIDDYNKTGVSGLLLTSKTNRNSIFFPASGFCYNSLIGRMGSGGFYWTASIDSYVDAWYMHLGEKNQFVLSDARYCGFTLRGVFN